MREYVVQPGDSPAKIAISFAQCPKCARDLVLSPGNSHKDRVTHPNGFVTFKELRAGERLELPEKWFDGSMDELPNSYFQALPYADGVTPGVGQATAQYHAPPSVVDALGAAQAVVTAVAADPNYCQSVSQPGSPVNTAIHEFKVAWNAVPNVPQVPLGTGTVEPSTADALATVLGANAPKACPQPLPVVPAVGAPVAHGLSTGSVVGIGLAAAAVVGGIAYVATRKPSRRRRRR